MNVTLYKETYVSPRSVVLSSVIESIKSGKTAKMIYSFRTGLQNCILGANYPEEKKPPAVLFSITYKKVDGQVNIKEYNGIILIELNDLAGTNEIRTVCRKASEAPQTLAAFKGSGGKSVKILIRFTLPDGNLPKQQEDIERFHAHAYRKAVNFYRMLLEREITLKRPVPERGCRLSFDPDLYYNPDALSIILEQPFQMPVEETWHEIKQHDKDPLERLLPGIERSHRISLLYETSLKETLNYFGGFDSADPKHFLIRLAENCHHSGIPEEDTIKWSVFHTELKGYEMELRETVRNVYLLKKGFGMKPCIHPSQQLALQMDEFMQRRYEFRRNELRKEVEYRERRSYYFDFLPVTDEALNTFSLQAHAEGLNFWDRDVKRYVYSNRIPLHNPIDHYLYHLPKWDSSDHIRKLAGTIPTKNPYWKELFYRWFLGMVAQWRQMNRTYGNSVVPLLVGDQGCGKSTWCRKLMPFELLEYYTDSIDFSSKREAELCLHRFALINLDEFDSISANHQPFLKHLLQKPVINSRRPYKNTIHSLKRYGVFIATCNNMDLLTDPTGSRRFLCIEIDGRIDLSLPIDHNQLYAQAMIALRSGERYWFTKEDEQLITQNNQSFEQMPVEEQLLLRYFRPVNDEEDGEWLPAIEILQRIQKRSKVKISNTNMKHFARILRKNNIPKRHSSTGNQYYIIEVNE